MTRARAGDDPAAEALGNHFGATGQRDEERRWHRLAAERGHCRSLSALQNIAFQSRDRPEYVRLNNSLREHQCTLGRMYPEGMADLNGAAPMWDEAVNASWNGH